MKVLVEIIGWAGAAVILAAYALNSGGKVQANDRSYQLMNVVGALALVINGSYNGAFPSAVLNVVWMGIGSYSLWRASGARLGR